MRQILAAEAHTAAALRYVKAPRVGGAQTAIHASPLACAIALAAVGCSVCREIRPNPTVRRFAVPVAGARTPGSCSARESEYRMLAHAGGLGMKKLAYALPVAMGSDVPW